MPKIVSVHSLSAGAGKTSIAANLAAALACAGSRVAVVDADLPSPALHPHFGLKPEQTPCTLNCFLWGECAIDKAAYDVTESIEQSHRVSLDGGGIFVVPASVRGGAIARILREGYNVSLLNDGFFDLIAELRLDYLLVDTHPGMDERTLLSVAVSDLLLLVVGPGEQDFERAAATFQTLRRHEVSRMLVLINKAPGELNRQSLREKIESQYGTEVAAIFPLCAEMEELRSRGIYLLQYPDSPLGRELEHAARAVMQPDSQRQTLAV